MKSEYGFSDSFLEKLNNREDVIYRTVYNCVAQGMYPMELIERLADNIIVYRKAFRENIPWLPPPVDSLCNGAYPELQDTFKQYQEISDKLSANLKETMLNYVDFKFKSLKK